MNRLFNNRYRPADLLLLIYLAGMFRQFLWPVEQQVVAWALTAAASALAVAAHAAFREPEVGPKSSLGRLAWLACACPLLLIFLLRSPFPDHNFDVLNYHLAHIERALRGWPFIPGDFLPTSIQFNPLPDMAAGISKYLLGHRLGPLINVGAVLWTAAVAERILRESVDNKYFLRLAAVVVVSTELILYLLSTYLVDLLALPLLLEATHLALNFKGVRRKNYTLLHVGLFLGMALAMKLTNLAYIIPIAALLLFNAYGHRGSLKPSAVLAGVMLMAAPALPFMAYMTWATGSPVFPFYNRLFRSDLWLLQNISDPIHGPKNILETLLWPLWVYVYPERGSEFSGGDAPYTGRIALGFILSLVALLSPQVKGAARQLAGVTLFAVMLWNVSTGNLRYGIFLEVLGGLVIVSTLVSIFDYYRRVKPLSPLRLGALAASFALVAGMQVFNSYRQAATIDQKFYGDKVQPTIFQEPRTYFSEAAHFFGDRHALDFLPAEQRAAFGEIDVWVNACPTTSGLMATLKPEAPMISVTPFLQTVDVFYPLQTRAGLEAYRAAMTRVTGKRLYSLTHEKRLNDTLGNLARAGLSAVQVTKLKMPFYSTSRPLSVALIEVRFPEDLEARAQ